MRRLALASLFVLATTGTLVASQWAGTLPPPTNAVEGFRAISESDAKRHLEYLAGPETEGRGSGQPGFQKAADYMAARFKEYGLKPGGENGTYFQYGSLYRGTLESGSLKSGGMEIPVGPDLNFGEVYGDANVSGRVVLLRVRDKLGDLPNGVNLRGAIVLLSGPGVDASIRTDVRIQDPAMILTVRPTVPKLAASVRQREPSRWRIQGSLSEQGLQRIAKAAGTDLPDTLSKPVEVIELGDGVAAFKVNAGEVKVPNVVGILPGTDASLGEEHVAIGAHLDHLGTDGTTTHWGADDDGSGSTALLEVAKAFSVNPVKPRRTIVFMAFYGEEMGLLGSKLYASQPTLPLSKMVAELQMDMVGRNSYGAQNGDKNRIDKEEENRDTMRLVGSKRISTELHEAVLEANKHVGFRFLYDGEDVYERSDHYSFASKGVPIAFLFDGFTPDYHEPTDTVDKINFTKLTNAAKLFFLTAFDIANRDKPLVKDVK
jgi:hypothetical protein